MTAPVRLGAVDYLNARPLVHGLDRPAPVGSSQPDLIVRFDVPSVCARLLDEGAIDLGLIPTIAYLGRPGDRVVPGIGIVSDGPVDSVAIFTRRPIQNVRSLALDTSSRTSVALTRVLCARVFGASPVFVPHAPDLGSMLSACDAALLIGDPALFADHRALGAEKIDLGETWANWTSRPFVWAFWAGRSGAADEDVVRRLQDVRDAGRDESDAIADAYCDGNPDRQAIARRYLRDSIKYELSDRALEGVRTFYHEAAVLGLVDREGPIQFF